MQSSGNPDGSGLFGIVRVCWPLGVLAAFLNIWSSVESTVYVPYLYTRVTCCGQHDKHMDKKYDITTPSKVDAILEEAASLGLSARVVNNRIAACDIPAFPHFSKMWSQSPGCVNAAFVKDRAQRVISISVPFKAVFTFYMMPAGGACADACGRRPVLLAYSLMCLLACIIFMLDTKLCHLWGPAMLQIAGMLICPCMEAKDAIMAGSVTDLVGEHRSARDGALSILFAFGKAGMMVGLIASYWVLRRHVSSYFLSWAASSCIALFVVAFTYLIVPETLAKEKLSSIKAHMFDPGRTFHHAFTLMFADKTLTILLWFGFLSCIHSMGMTAVMFSYLMQHGFSQEEVMLPGVLSNVITVLSSSVLARCRDSLGVTNRIIIASALWIISYALLGPFFGLIGHAAPYIAFACVGMGGSLCMPAMQTIVSQRVGEENQARCQSAFAAFTKLGEIVGALVWSIWLFDATDDTGFTSMKPAIASLCVTAVCTYLAVQLKMQNDCERPLVGQPPWKSYGICHDARQVRQGP
mmetsp:Transcript_133808/g.286190  ORF Transcript_133808/g.286190 Transcript_133808/m.286190 type:complete len:524 (+) Transcript_133808:85-1656(+)